MFESSTNNIFIADVYGTFSCGNHQHDRLVRLETATEVIDAAERRADEIDTPVVVTVANSAGDLVAQHRMDGAGLASVDISRNKAYTAAPLDTPTHERAEPTKPGEPLSGLRNTDQRRMVIFGGYPSERDGGIVGAISVSGGAVEQDLVVAESGVEKRDELTA